MRNLALFFTIPLLTVASSEAQMRYWTNVDGKRSHVEMEYVEVQQSRVLLRDAANKQFRYQFSRLSTQDQDFIRARIGKRDAVGEQPEKRPPDGKWALLVGINRYANMSDLRYCRSDVAQLRLRLLNLGYPDNHIFVISDDAADASLQPTRENIQDWLDRLLSGRIIDSEERGLTPLPRLVGPSDQIVVAFSGHGVQLDGTSYFCPPEADLDKPGETLVPMQRVYQDLASVSKGLRLLLVDACRSVPRRREAKAAELSAFEVNNVPMGVYALSSCSAGQASLEDSSLRQGVFSYFVQAALAGAGAQPGADGKTEIRLNQVTTYAIDQTMAYSKNIIKHKQTPHSISNIGGNPLLGVLDPSHRIAAENVVSSASIGPKAQRYGLDLARVRPPELPAGWQGPAGLVTSDEAGFRTLKSNADSAVEATSPRIDMRGDFFLEMEVGGNASMQLTLLGDGGPDMVVQLRNRSGRWSFQLPELRERSFKSLGNPGNRVASLVRLERIRDVFTLIINSDVSKRFDYRYPQHEDFRGLKIRINDNELLIYDLQIGPLPRRVRNSQEQTATYVAEARGSGLPDGWRRVGQSVDLNQRLIGPADKVKIRGDFYFEFDVRTEKDGLFAITFKGRDGDRPLKIPFHVNNRFIFFALPTVEAKYVRGTDISRLRLERKNDDFLLRVNGEPVHAWRGGGFGDFDGFQIDLIQFVPLDNFKIGPLNEDAVVKKRHPPR